MNVKGENVEKGNKRLQRGICLENTKLLQVIAVADAETHKDKKGFIDRARRLIPDATALCLFVETGGGREVSYLR